MDFLKAHKPDFPLRGRDSEPAKSVRNEHSKYIELDTQASTLL